MLRIWDPDGPTPGSEKVVLCQEMQGRRTSSYCHSSKCSTSRVGRMPLREKPTIVPSPSSRALALRCYLGGEASQKADSSNSMHKGTNFVCRKARQTSNLKVFCRTLEVVLKGS